jgi:hypothetical protein
VLPRAGECHPGAEELHRSSFKKIDLHGLLADLSFRLSHPALFGAFFASTAECALAVALATPAACSSFLLSIQRVSGVNWQSPKMG